MRHKVEHTGDIELLDLTGYLEHGDDVSFPNGCFVSFEINDGFIGADNPYGQETLFAVMEDDCLADIHRWLLFWNDNRDEYGRLVSETADTIKLDALRYSSRYCRVQLKSVVFTRVPGSNAFSMQGVVVNGTTFSYWCSQCVEKSATPGNIIHANCLRIDAIRTAIETGSLDDSQVFL